MDSFSFQLGPIINISIFFSFVRFRFLVILGYTGTKVAGQNLRDTLCAANRKPLGTDVHHSAPKVTGLLSGSLTLVLSLDISFFLLQRGFVARAAPTCIRST